MNFGNSPGAPGGRLSGPKPDNFPTSKLVVLLSVLSLMAALAAAASAQTGQTQEKPSVSEAWPMGRMYDPKTVEKLDGKIEAVEQITAGRMDIPTRVVLKLKTAKETITVYLGPEWYLEQQKLKLAPGDYIQVRGSRITMDNKPMILPNEVIKKNKVVKIWDDQGRPQWRGQGPRSQQK